MDKARLNKVLSLSLMLVLVTLTYSDDDGKCGKNTTQSTNVTSEVCTCKSIQQCKTETVIHTESCPHIMSIKTITDIVIVTTTPTSSGGTLGAPNHSTALGGLGAVTGLLAITLVGVVLGWVWSCQRKYKLEARDSTLRVPSCPNPSYSATSLPLPRPSIQYSSTGPQDTPPSNTTPGSVPEQGEEESIYHMLEETEYQVLEGEGENYYELENEVALTYEVPVLGDSLETRAQN